MKSVAAFCASLQLGKFLMFLNGNMSLQRKEKQSYDDTTRFSNQALNRAPIKKIVHSEMKINPNNVCISLEWLTRMMILLM